MDKKELEKKVTAVWLIQRDKRFLLNYFDDSFTAQLYVYGLKRFKINGELLYGEVSLKELMK